MINRASQVQELIVIYGITSFNLCILHTPLDNISSPPRDPYKYIDSTVLWEDMLNAQQSGDNYENSCLFWLRSVR